MILDPTEMPHRHDPGPMPDPAEAGLLGHAEENAQSGSTKRGGYARVAPAQGNFGGLIAVDKQNIHRWRCH